MSGKLETISVQEFKSSYWNVVLIPNFLTSEEADLLMKEGESLFEDEGKIQKRRTNLTLGERKGMKYKVKFGYGSSARTTIRQTLAYESIPSLVLIRSKIEKIASKNGENVNFPMCAALRYPNGKYGIKRHRDREVPAGSIIAGLSVGERRTLVLSQPRGGEPCKLDLSPGSLYIFYPPTNERAFHSIEEEPDRKGARISFTFRTNWTSE